MEGIISNHPDLLDEVKQYLRITWDNEDTNIQMILNGGAAYLNDLANGQLDFTNDFLAKQLILDYTRYVYNHSFELFQHNFGSELLSLLLREGVKEIADEETDPEADS